MDLRFLSIPLNALASGFWLSESGGDPETRLENGIFFHSEWHWLRETNLVDARHFDSLAAGQYLPCFSALHGICRLIPGIDQAGGKVPYEPEPPACRPLRREQIAFTLA